MSRRHEALFAGKYAAQEARRAGVARAADHEYASGEVIDTIPRESGAQYGQGVPGGELQGNLREVAQVQRPAPNDEGRANVSVAPSVKAPAGGESPSSAGHMDPRVAPQMTLLELRSLRFDLPFPPSVNEAWHHVPFVDENEPNRRRRLKVRTVLTDEHRYFRTQVISIVHGEMRKIERRAQPLTGRVQLEIRLYYANRRRTDVDNRVKPLQDALTHAGAYRDDSQVDRLIVERIVVGGEERCEVVLREIAA